MEKWGDGIRGRIEGKESTKKESKIHTVKY